MQSNVLVMAIRLTSHVTPYIHTCAGAPSPTRLGQAGGGGRNQGLCYILYTFLIRVKQPVHPQTIDVTRNQEPKQRR